MEEIKLKNGDRIRAENIKDVITYNKTKKVWQLAIEFYNCILQIQDTKELREVENIVKI